MPLSDLAFITGPIPIQIHYFLTFKWLFQSFKDEFFKTFFVVDIFRKATGGDDGPVQLSLSSITQHWVMNCKTTTEAAFPLPPPRKD